VKTVEGQVLSENQAMLSMNQALGFRIEDDPAEPGVRKVTLDLTDPPAGARTAPDADPD
jgi:acetyltransferase